MFVCRPNAVQCPQRPGECCPHALVGVKCLGGTLRNHLYRNLVIPVPILDAPRYGLIRQTQDALEGHVEARDAPRKRCLTAARTAEKRNAFAFSYGNGLPREEWLTALMARRYTAHCQYDRLVPAPWARRRRRPRLWAPPSTEPACTDLISTVSNQVHGVVVMADENHRDPGIAHLPKEVEYASRGRGIECGERLVQHKNLRFGGECGSDEDALLLAA